VTEATGFFVFAADVEGEIGRAWLAFVGPDDRTDKNRKKNGGDSQQAEHRE